MTPRRLQLLVIALAFALGGPAGAFADGDGGRSGDNAAVAINTKNDSSRFRFAYDLERESGDVVDNENVAFAYASCERCRTTAIAVQIVLVSSSPSTVTPKNFAVALNENCSLCETFASSFQFVVGVEDESVRFTKEGKTELHRILTAFRDLKRETYTLPEFHARTGALADEIRTVLRTQLAPKAEGGDDPDVDVDEETDGMSG
jgi:putative peptide zinc metalloprotease protein